MHKLKHLPILFILVMMSVFVAGPSTDVSASRLEGISPSLGAAASYSVLAGTTVTNTGPTTMPGDLGVSPGTAVVGFPPGIVGPPGTIHAGDANAAAAQADSTAAFTFLDQSCDTTYPGVQDLTLVSPLGPGTYCATAFTLSGNLTLSGSGVWIFKSASTLITSPGSSVTGGDPCNLWWRVGSSATLDTTTSFIGNILALTSITLNTNANLDGRALAQTGAVMLDSNVITGPNCGAQATETPTSAPPTETPTATTGAPTATTGAPTATTGAPTTTTAPPEATATSLPVVTALPGTGGAPIRNDVSPWGLLIAGGFSALALILGFRAYRKTSRPRQ
ncbi:MAG TPA: ice-binding family protein [Anaerolineales bacterium]